jgi:acyl-coenzyme A thioesterase PaaI-like protein
MRLHKPPDLPDGPLAVAEDDGEHLEIVKTQLERANYSKSFGIVLDKLTDDTIQMHMQLREDMLNMYNRTHGGIIYSLAYAAF